MKTRAAMIVTIGCGIVWTGCSGGGTGGGASEGIGEVRVALAQVPADVKCVQLTVAGATRSVVQPFDVAAGQSTSILSIAGAPLGADTVTGQAFSTACAAVGLSSVPDWVSDAVPATVQAGTAADVILVMHRNGQVSACVDFQDDDAGAVVPGCAVFHEFTPMTAKSGPLGITVGPDHALWFTEGLAVKIGRVTTDGTVSEFDPKDPAAGAFLQEITTGPDGNLWFTADHTIGRLNPSTGVFAFFTLPSTFLHSPIGITTGPDGNIWYTAENENGGADVIGHLDVNGTELGEIPVPGVLTRLIMTGPDNALWFSSLGVAAPNGGLVRYVPSTNHFDFFFSKHPSATHFGIASGFGQDLWFTIAASDADHTPNFIGHMDTSGAEVEYPIPSTTANGSINATFSIARGPDGNFWFAVPTASFDDNAKSGKIGRITPSGNVALFPTPDPNAGPMEIVAGPDGNMWFTEFSSGKVAYIVP
jgi:virginiamycin B lyase